MPTFHRLEKLSKELVRELSQIILYELNDPRMGFVTIVRVKLSKDLKQAWAYVSVLGDEKKKRLVMHGLHHARGFIQKTLGERIRIRSLPMVEFELDESIEKTVSLVKKIEEVVGKSEEE